MQSPYVLNHCNAEPLQTLTYIVRTSKRSKCHFAYLGCFSYDDQIFVLPDRDELSVLNICIAFITGGKVRQIQRGGANVLHNKIQRKIFLSKIGKKSRSLHCVEAYSDSVDSMCSNHDPRGLGWTTIFLFYIEKNPEKKSLEIHPSKPIGKTICNLCKSILRYRVESSLFKW